MSLLKAIDSFVKLANKIRSVWISEPLRLLHENSFNKGTMQKGILNINLSKAPPMINSNGEN